MKHIPAKGIKLAYGGSKCFVMFGEDEISKMSIPRHRFAHEKKSKKMNHLKVNAVCFY